jgi:hypothetical protein
MPPLLSLAGLATRDGYRDNAISPALASRKGGARARPRAIVVQQKTSRPVQFALLEPSRGSILARLKCRCGTLDEFVFPSRIVTPIISALGSMLGIDEWVTGIGLRPEYYAAAEVAADCRCGTTPLRNP